MRATRSSLAVLLLAERYESGLLYRLSGWLSLPWRCKFSHAPVPKSSYLDSYYGVPEQEWIECGRCGHWIDHA